MKHISVKTIWGLIFFLIASSLFAGETLFSGETNEEPPHPQSVHYSPKHFAGFIGLDLGGGLTREPVGVFNTSIQGGVIIYYKDMQADLMSSVMGLFLHTALYAGFDFNFSNKRFAWAPKIGIAQLLGPIIFGLEAFAYTPNTFKEYDIRLYPYFGVSLLNLFSLTAGPIYHVGGVELEQISRWRVYFTLRMPIELIRYFMGL